MAARPERAEVSESQEPHSPQKVLPDCFHLFSLILQSGCYKDYYYEGTTMAQTTFAFTLHLH